MTDLSIIMREAGWHYDKASHGFARGEMWVSWQQAEAALSAAETGEVVTVRPASRITAEIKQAATNTNERPTANDK